MTRDGRHAGRGGPQKRYAARDRGHERYTRRKGQHEQHAARQVSSGAQPARQHEQHAARQASGAEPTREPIRRISMSAAGQQVPDLPVQEEVVDGGSSSFLGDFGLAADRVAIRQARQAQQKAARENVARENSARQNAGRQTTIRQNVTQGQDPAVEAVAPHRAAGDAVEGWEGAEALDERRTRITAEMALNEATLRQQRILVTTDIIQHGEAPKLRYWTFPCFMIAVADAGSSKMILDISLGGAFLDSRRGPEQGIPGNSERWGY